MSSERHKHTMRQTLAVLTARGLHIKVIFGKDLKSVKFQKIEARVLKLKLKSQISLTLLLVCIVWPNWCRGN